MSLFKKYIVCEERLLLLAMRSAARAGVFPFHFWLKNWIFFGKEARSFQSHAGRLVLGHASNPILIANTLMNALLQ